MTNTELAVFGIAAASINILAEIPFIRAVFAGKAKPERATYWMWFVLSIVGFFGQLAGGAHWSLLLTGSSTLVGGFAAILSIKYGYGRFHKRDTIGLMVTALGVIAAIFLKSPLLAVVTVLLIDFWAAGLTIYKTWYAPFTENFLAWRISTIGTICGVLAVGHYKPVIFLSPLSNFLINLVMVSIIYTRRQKVKHQPDDI